MTDEVMVEVMSLIDGPFLQDNTRTAFVLLEQFFSIVTASHAAKAIQHLTSAR
jgi:hypothetical protein